MCKTGINKTPRQGGLCIVRPGHMGDVLMTEPIARALRESFQYIALCTELIHVGELLEVYDEVIPYQDFLENRLNEFERVVEIFYEDYPGCHHFDGYSRFMGLSLNREVPQIRRGFPRIVRDTYGLIAPDTSRWIQSMRQWPRERFQELSHILEEALGFQFVMLSSAHGFAEMLSLIEHSSCFIGNDSGPAILSQSFGRPTFVLFGATRADLILLDPEAVGIQIDVGCNGCKHFSRHTEIECASPMCLELLEVQFVAARVIESFKRRQP